MNSIAVTVVMAASARKTRNLRLLLAQKRTSYALLPRPLAIFSGVNSDHDWDYLVWRLGLLRTLDGGIGHLDA